MLDLDGTLIDSVKDLTVALQLALADVGKPKVDESEVRLWVGNGAAMLVKRGLARSFAPESVNAVDPVLHQACLDRFLHHYGECCALHTVIYDGVLDAIARWQSQDIKLAIVTNKPITYTLRIIEGLGLAGAFDLVLGGDSLPEKKPSAFPLTHCIEALKVDKSQTVMVGDSRTDILSARAADVPIICVSYGYNHGNSITAENPDFVVDSLAQIG